MKKKVSHHQKWKWRWRMLGGGASAMNAKREKESEGEMKRRKDLRIGISLKDIDFLMMENIINQATKNTSPHTQPTTYLHVYIF